MGNSLSFPLLCLQNYLAFKYFVPRDVPVRINGDDIVFRGRQEEWERWSAGVNSCGLKLSFGKTMVDRNVFSLNSTFFRAGMDRVYLCPVIRSTVFERGLEHVGGISGRLKTFQRFPREQRAKLRADLMKTFKRSIEWSQRSVRRGLESRVCYESLRSAGLLEREFFYLSVPKETPIQKATLDGYTESRLPEGWHRERSLFRVDQVEQKSFREEMIECAWLPSRRIPQKDPREGTFGWYREVTKKRCRLLKVRFGNLWRRMYGGRLPTGKGWGTVRWVRTADRETSEVVSYPESGTVMIPPPPCLELGGIYVHD